MNVAIVNGNITRDPELRTTTGGTSVVGVGLAHNERRKDKQTGEYTEIPHYFDVTVWGAYGELVADKLKKGDSVVVKGRLEYQEWQNDAGEKRKAIKIIADEIDGDWKFRPRGGAPAAPKAEQAELPADPPPVAATPDDDDIPF